MTDTSCYSPALRTLSRVSKVHAIQHLDMVSTTQGDLGFGLRWQIGAQALAEECYDFDDFRDRAHEVMREAWERAETNTDSAVFIVGYSAERGRCVAYGYPSEDDFTPFEIKGLFVHPSPLSMRPSDWELARMGEYVHAADVETLRSRPKAPKPASVADWVALATDARTMRAMAPVESGLKTGVIGQVHHTTITRGAIHTATVHEFDDSGEEFQRIVAGTYHPQSAARTVPLRVRCAVPRLLP